MTLFGSFRALNRKSRRQSQARTQHQIPHQLNSQTQAGEDRAQNIAEIEAYTGPCHLLNLPLEIRELILCWLYDAVIVYLRTQPPDEETGIRRDDVIEWENHCAALLLVNRQLREEALHIVLQSCVLDIWGSSAYNIYFLRNLPKAAGQIRNIAITFDRCELCICTPSFFSCFCTFVCVLQSPSILTVAASLTFTIFHFYMSD